MTRIEQLVSNEEWEALEPELIKWRRHIHRHPDIAYEEQGTVRFVCESLGELGIEHFTLLDGTAVCGIIRGGDSGPVIGIRADMDALPIKECTGLPYASENEGVMHACGHDVHTAVLLGIAAVLQAHREDLSGSVKLFKLLHP